MTHNVDLILTLAGSLTIALLFGMVTQKLKMSPIVGYLLAGIIVGPYFPGIAVDIDTASQFAEIGIILLMFSIGLHFHLKDLIAVKNIALPGAIAQIAGSTMVGMIIAHAFGWPWHAGAVFGIAISVASTVVLTRVLEDNKKLHTLTGHIAIGWLIVEDLFTILVLVLLPTLFIAGGHSSQDFWTTLWSTILKLLTLILMVLVMGQKFIPKILVRVAQTGARDLFTLAVLVLAIGIAVMSAKFFGASMALGAFLAGMVVGQSDFSARAASEALSIKDAFAVLFFVSVGMLINPVTVIDNWELMLATLAIILIIKPLIAVIVVLLLKHPLKTAVSVGVALAQIGEFSFILASLGVFLKVLPPEAYSAIIAAAIISIILNPLLYKGIDPLMKKLANMGIGTIKPNPEDGIAKITEEGELTIVIGYGPVGQSIARILLNKGIKVVVIELNINTVQKINNANIEGLFAVHGDAAQKNILTHAGIAKARALVISSPAATATEIIEIARSLNPKIQILTNTTYIKEATQLKKAGADIVFSSEGAVARIISGYMFNEFTTLNEHIDQE